MSKNPDKYDQPPPPAHLSPEMQEFWLRVFRDRRLQVAQIFLLQKAAESYDRAEAARKILDSEGMVFTDRFGQPRARPEANIEVLNRAQFQKLIARCGVNEMYFIYERKKGSR